MTIEHKPDCIKHGTACIVHNFDGKLPYRCTCGADKPTPPAPTAAAVREAVEWLNRIRSFPHISLGKGCDAARKHSNIILRALDNAQGDVDKWKAEEADTRLLAQKEIEYSSALRAENARLVEEAESDGAHAERQRLDIYGLERELALTKGENAAIDADRDRWQSAYNALEDRMRDEDNALRAENDRLVEELAALKGAMK